MGFLRIHCRNCGNSWEVYERDTWTEDRHRVCPHCFAEIDSQVWTSQVLPGFGQMLDANKEVVKHYTGYLEDSLFFVDYVEDHNILSEKESDLYEIRSKIDELQVILSELSEAVQLLAAMAINQEATT